MLSPVESIPSEFFPLRCERADAVICRALGVRFTAAVLRVEHRGRAVFERAYGFVDEARSAPVYVSTRFDLASLTKPFTAMLALREVAAGRLGLDGPLLDLIPEWRGREHELISVRMLLAHVSGMQSGADYRTLFNDSVERFTLTRALTAAPRERVIYSDLGFIALGVILERLRGHSLPSLMKEMRLELRAPTISYRPRAEEVGGIPATEHDGWRGRVRGVVHDEKAYLLNGIAGHAGLFGAACDVAALTEAFLGPTHGRSPVLLPSELVREALRVQAEDEILRRGLGWMLKKSDDNSCGARMGEGTFGHTGFTGTCVWADPARDVQIVFLTNAVYFGRSDLRSVRAAVCDAVIEEFDQRGSGAAG